MTPKSYRNLNLHNPELWDRFDYRDVRPRGKPISERAKLEAKSPISDMVATDINLYRSAS